MRNHGVRAVLARLLAGTRRPASEEGFTLIELMMVALILPLIIGAVTVVMITTLKATDTHNNQGVKARLDQGHDTQITSTEYVRDIQSAESIQTNNPAVTNTPICGTGNQILALEWNLNLTTTGPTFVSYVLTTVGGNNAIVRNYCTASTSGGTPTLKGKTTVSHNAIVPPSTGSITTPTLTCVAALVSTSGCATGSTAQGPFAAQYVALVEIDVPETGGVYTFQLKASPRQSFAQITCPASGCLPPAPPLLLLGSAGASCASGNPSVTVNGVAAVNSSSPGSLAFHNGDLTSTQVYSQNPSTTYPGTTGSTTVSPASDYNYTGSGGAYANGGTLVDPYSSLPVPNPSAPNTFVYNTALTGPNDLVTGNLKSGIYILNAGITLNGNTNLGTDSGGVFLYVTGGSVVIGGTAATNLNAMTSGPYAGILLFDTPSNPTQSITLDGSGGATSLNGVIAAPAANVTLKGGGSGTGLMVLGLTANSLSCNGNGSAVLGPQMNTNTALASTANPAPSLTSVTFTATVSSATTGYPAPPGGTVDFKETPNGGVAVDIPGCSAVSLSATGTASCTTATLTQANSPYSIQATYSGTPGYNGSNTGTSNPLTETVVTGLTLASSANPSLSGQSVTFTATLPSAGLPGSTVTFTIKDKNNTAYTCTGGTNVIAVSGTSAACSIGNGILLSTVSPFSVGATYSGDGSTASLTQTVNTGKVHVSLITGSGAITGSHWKATVNVTVVDSLGNTVANVVVAGSFAPSGPTPTGGTTAGTGICTFTTGNINNSVASETWTVSNLTLAGYTYDATANLMSSKTIPQ